MYNMVQFLLVIVAGLQLCTTGCICAVTKQKQNVEDPVFLDNYIPASMQVLLYLSEMMKYDFKPATEMGASTTTTVRPTPAHKPGYYAPPVPPKPMEPTRRVITIANDHKIAPEDIERARDADFPTLQEDLDLLGAGPSQLLHQINALDDVDTIGEEEQMSKFFMNYEDTSNVFEARKRIPPTRAYVTFLTLYDVFKREAKELGLNKYNGYTDKIIDELIATSSGTSEEQLKFVLSKVLEKKNTVKPTAVDKIQQILDDLEKPNGFVVDAIKYIPPLLFSK